MFPVRKVGSKPFQGCTTNAKVVFEDEREDFHGLLCQKLQKDPKSKRIEILLSSREVRRSLCMQKRTDSVLYLDR